MSKQVEHARLDPALALASIFRPITRGRRPGGLEMRTEFDGLRLKWMIWQALDSRDQSVLYAAAGMAGFDADRTIGSDAPGEQGQALWCALKAEDEAKRDEAVVVTTSRWALLKAAKLDDNKRHYEMLIEILDRLSMVGLRAEREGWKWSMRFLSWNEAPDGRINIALNGRFAAALAGQHVRVSLEERGQISGDAAQIAHAWLSAWIRPGRTQQIGLDRLAVKVWGNEAASDSTTRSRRERIGKALKEIAKLPGWQVTTTGRGASAKAIIRRPNILDC